jgi:enoyl-CoA hydratase/carnithine racemase
MSALKAKIAAMFEEMPDAKTNMLFEAKGSRLWITLNRPKRYNAFTMNMYTKLVNKIIEANKDDSIKYIIISGNGGNFSSGNDLNNFQVSASVDASVEEKSKFSADIIFDLTEAIIDSRKPIFAITEGRSIGFAFTQLLLYDQVWSVEGGDFSAPLVKLAQGP